MIRCAVFQLCRAYKNCPSMYNVSGRDGFMLSQCLHCRRLSEVFVQKPLEPAPRDSVGDLDDPDGFRGFG